MNNENDRLKDLFERQQKFQELTNNLPIINIEHRQEYINIQSLALIVEITEALQETPWKPWKQNSTYDRLKFQKELIDCWHFLINLSLVAFETENDFYQMFIEKNNINIKRQEDGY